MLRKTPPTGSTALIHHSINQHPVETDREADANVHDCAASSCQPPCHSYAVEYMCAPWKALAEVASETICGESEDRHIGLGERIGGCIISPLVAAITTVPSCFGFFIGAGRDVYECGTSRCYRDTDAEAAPQPVQMKQ